MSSSSLYGGVEEGVEVPGDCVVLVVELVAGEVVVVLEEVLQSEVELLPVQEHLHVTAYYKLSGLYKAIVGARTQAL